MLKMTLTWDNISRDVIKMLKQKINFSSIKAEGENEKKFISLLEEKKSVVFDWGQDLLRVENTNVFIQYSDFSERTNTFTLTSADTVFLLRYNGIAVSIVNASTFKSKNELSVFMKEMEEKVSYVRNNY